MNEVRNPLKRSRLFPVSVLLRHFFVMGSQKLTVQSPNIALIPKFAAARSVSVYFYNFKVPKISASVFQTIARLGTPENMSSPEKEELHSAK
jgi:hypothetical protein